ncbi:MAG: NTP transferase domain-containing protein [Eubacterium sp.]|nr:NTP transferase domain-containing protein [Eubacterium sp.]
MTDEYSRVLFTPADIPLIPASAIKALLARTEPLVYPGDRIKKGHPVSIYAAFLDMILSFDGDGGLRGALSALPVEPVYLAIDDPGIHMDMDTPEDYQKILEASK